MQEIQKKIITIQGYVDKLDILTLDRFVEGIINDEFPSDFSQIIERKNALTKLQNNQSYIL